MKLGKKILSSVCAMALLVSSIAAPASAAYDANECYAEGYDVSVQIAAEGSVLLKNEGGILPLAEGTEVSSLGAMSYD